MTSEKKKLNNQPGLSCGNIPSCTLMIVHQRIRYEPDFVYDYEDEEEAGEEVYRTSLCKLYQRIVGLWPNIVLQFVCQCLKSLPRLLLSSQCPCCR